MQRGRVETERDRSDAGGSTTTDRGAGGLLNASEKDLTQSLGKFDGYLCVLCITILEIFRSLRKFFEPGPSLPLRHSGESRNPGWVVVRETGSP
jgi:hypothetical protein